MTDEPRPRGTWYTNIFAAYGASLAWVIVVLTLFRLFFVPIGAENVMPGLHLTFYLLDRFLPVAAATMKESPAIVLFIALFCAPVFEELLFRMLPLSLVQGRGKNIERAVLLGVCCTMFGYVHGSIFNVFIQGFVGLTLGWLYLRNSHSQLTSYLSCVIVHALYNLTVIFWWVLIPARGG